MSILGYIKDVFVQPAKYRKFWVALASFVLTVLTIAFKTSPYVQALATAVGPIGVLVRGGNELKVGFDKIDNQFRNVTLTGPAEFVFEGTIEV